MTGLWLRIPNVGCSHCPPPEDDSEPRKFANVASLLTHLRTAHGLTGRAFGIAVDEVRLAVYCRIDEAPRRRMPSGR
jgi:hypothetical protein